MSVLVAFRSSLRRVALLRRWVRVTALIACCVSPCATHCAADDSGIAALVGLLKEIDDPDFQLDMLKGIQAGLKGRRHVAMPSGWTELYQSRLSRSANDEVRRRAQALALTFGDRTALAALRKTVSDTSQSTARRRSALMALVGVRPPNFANDLLPLIAEASLNDVALKALAEQTDERIPNAILENYPNFDRQRRQIALDTLSARTSFAHVLLASLDSGTIPRTDITADIIRKMELLNDDDIQEQIAKSWGNTRRTPAEKHMRIADLRQQLTAESNRDPDLSRGRGLFVRTCQQCHKLYGEGGIVGPDITGSQRANLEYLLLNVVDPNAAIGKDYQPWTFETDDGRVVVGIVTHETKRTITLRTPTADVTLDRQEIDTRDQLATSMMPEGLLDQLKPDELKDLVAYLGTSEQVPLPSE